MGFPSGHTQVLLPQLLITVLSFLDPIRRLTFTLLHPMGLSDPHPSRPETASVSASLIREMLPAARYGELPGQDRTEGCAVCLYEFEGEDLIRRLRNCQHMFHRGCVDRWIDDDRKTCPLCRKCLVPDELQEAYNDKLWAASGILDFYSENFLWYGKTSEVRAGAVKWEDICVSKAEGGLGVRDLQW